MTICRHNIFVWSLMATLPFLLLYFKEAKVFDYETGRVNIRTASANLDASPCTFEQLHQAYFSGNNRTRKRHTDCWSLNDQILRIPVNAILNRDNLTRLGEGRKGGVYKVILELPHGKQCSAAMKTDHCYPASSRFKYKVQPDDGRSCVSPHSSMWCGHSFLGAEYTGALIYYAQLQTNHTIPGLLPTWALIQDRKHPLNRRFPLVPLGGFPHPDRSVVGVVMPLENFAAASAPGILQFSRNSTCIAKLMLSAAQGLEFVNGMGLAFRDVQKKNIGILQGGETVVYDNSYLGLQPGWNCTAEACNFCHEHVFPKAVGEDLVHLTPGSHNHLESDFVHFREVFLALLKRCSDKETTTLTQESVQQCQSVQELVQTLKTFASNCASFH